MFKIPGIFAGDNDNDLWFVRANPTHVVSIWDQHAHNEQLYGSQPRYLIELVPTDVRVDDALAVQCIVLELIKEYSSEPTTSQVSPHPTEKISDCV